MYEVFRKGQRRRIQTVDYLTYSHLYMPSEWEFQSFGPLQYCLDTRQQPQCSIVRGPIRDTTVLTFLVSGELDLETASLEDIHLRSRDFALTVPGPGDSITYRTGPEEAQFFELGLETLSDEPVPSHQVAQVQTDGRTPALDCLASGQQHPGALPLPFDCAVYRAFLRTGENLIFETLLSRKLFILVLRGTLRLQEDRLLPRDSAHVRRVTSVPINAVQASELLLVDMV